jgi:peroxiredoxin Q/BCP
MISTGTPAPDFTLPASGGQTVTLSALRGKPVVLFMYGKDGTPTCTNEVMEFQALLPQFQAAGVTVLGLSKDPVKTHDKFVIKQGLTLTLLSDHGTKVMEAWDSHGEKLFFGKQVVGVLRNTFLIDAQGQVARIWKVDKVKDHAAEVLAAVLA